MTRWLLGDQLAPERLVDDGDRVLMIEVYETEDYRFATRQRYHPQKLTLVFAAMRAVRDRLREAGHEVVYLRAESFGAALDDYFDTHPGDTLALARPASHGAVSRLRDLVTERGGSLSVEPNPLYLTTPAEFDAWAGDRTVEDGFRQERWYRHVRRQTGYLMDGDDPAGGEWNYDDENRDTPPDGWSPPPVPAFDYDDRTRDTHAWVVDRFDDAWGSRSFDDFAWPVTREQALDALEHFLTHRLPEFGPYQDAMLDDEWALAHSLLSSSLNIGLLRPAEVVEGAIARYEAGEAPLNSVEGFVRQVVGWREFMRHVYRRAMPAMNEADQLDQPEDLPPLYYTRDTDMRCLEAATERVWRRGYAHHIERLMVLSNFALIYGADPHQLNEWFHLGFVDAYHWVTTPNVVGMGSFATDALSSKPYASSGNYVNKMSDHCANCDYAVSRTTGEGACPFNALYWDFLKQNEETLRGTGRMGLMYSHVDGKDDEEWADIEARAERVREKAREGDL